MIKPMIDRLGGGRQIAVYLFTIALSIAFLWVGHEVATRERPLFSTYTSQLVVQAKVQTIVERTTREARLGDQTLYMDVTVFRALLLEGEHKGTLLEAVHEDNPYLPYTLRPVKEGDKVFLQYTPESDYEARWTLQEYVRTDALGWLALFLVLLLILFGRSKGIHTIISLLFTCLAVFLVFVPSILAGQNIYASSLTVSLFIVVMTDLLVYGLNRKSICAILGSVSGLALSGLLIWVMDLFLELTGVIEEHSVSLLYLNAERPIDLKAIIFASILVGALGAVMDVGISIASSLWEVYTVSRETSMKRLMASGLQIGRDIVGTMSNTLLLAYIGSSLSLVLLLVAYNDSLMALLNKELIVVEILQALVGIAGLLFVIPFTSFISALLYTRKKEKTKDEG